MLESFVQSESSQVYLRKCSFCDAEFEEAGLKIHHGRVHKDIPRDFWKNILITSSFYFENYFILSFEKKKKRLFFLFLSPYLFLEK